MKGCGEGKKEELSWGGCRFSCPHPHILPTLLQLPPHPARGQPPTGGRGLVGWVGGVGTGRRPELGSPFLLPCFSARVGLLPFGLGLAPAGTLALSLRPGSA